MKDSMKDDLRGLHLHFEPLSGIAGDMTVAALVDAGVPRSVVSDAITAMRIPGLRVRFEKRRRGAYVGTGFDVTWPGMHHQHEHAHEHAHEDDHDHAHAHAHHEPHQPAAHDHPDAHDHRDYADIRRLLRRASLDKDARALAEDIFGRIAQVEGALHGMPTDRVTFHEVGAYDSIADVVGVAAAIAWLAPSGITSVPPVLGTGRVRTAHGIVPVPAPATAALLAGLPVQADGAGELTTPTGAAVLAAVVDEFRALPPVRLRAQGFGAGTRELADRPNVLRVILGEPFGTPLPSPPGDVLLLQANIDDMSPQLVEPLMAALFDAGALDAWYTSIGMKKGRPALEISALVAISDRADVERAFFENSTTIGLRVVAASRTVLSRSEARVSTPFGPVSVKVAGRDGGVRGATPEFEDCKRLAKKANVSVRQVLAAAQVAAAALLAPPVRRGRR